MGNVGYIGNMPKPATTEKRGAVYFIGQPEGGPVKIGAARDPRLRLAEFQIGSPDQLVILGQVVTDDYRAEERAHHRRFAHLRIRGEWFTRAPELIEYLATLPVSPERAPAPLHARVDTRRRVLLPKLAAEPGDLFFIDVRDDGSITLVRAATVPIGTLGHNDPAAD